MTSIQIHLCERLKQLGFSRNSQINLYGSEFELVGDPLVISDDVVFVDALERKSGQSCRVRIPLNTARMATEQVSQANAAPQRCSQVFHRVLTFNRSIFAAQDAWVRRTSSGTSTIYELSVISADSWTGTEEFVRSGSPIGSRISS